MFIRLFGTDEDIGESINLVPLSPLHPNIKVREEFLQDMDVLIAESKKEPTFIFRKLMEVLIPANNDWASAKGIDGMFTKYQFLFLVQRCNS